MTKDDIDNQLELVELSGEENVEIVEGVPVCPEGALPHPQKAHVHQQQHAQGHHQQD
jgi:hypothetical protein